MYSWDQSWIVSIINPVSIQCHMILQKSLFSFAEKNPFMIIINVE